MRSEMQRPVRRSQPSSARQVALSATASPQPNEVDCRRIERALERRARYRYVVPTVIPQPHGYRISSPCCSRNVDPVGGNIDIARLEYDDSAGAWNLYSKLHERHEWLLQATGRLHDLLELLNADPQRIFWQ